MDHQPRNGQCRDYREYAALVRVLARRPVNLNTAPPEVLQALFLNLQVAGRNSRITGDEAQKLATLVCDSRPFEGFEDFLRRAVLPAAGVEKLAADAPVVPAILAGLSGAGGGFIDPDDALALYMNGLNANDVGLAYATMPYSFVTRDTYVGQHGVSLRLDGLEPGFNDRASTRAIVIHGADYVNLDLVPRYGRIGRSWGCPALPTEEAARVIARIRGGSAVFAYFPDARWLAESRFLGADSTAA